MSPRRWQVLAALILTSQAACNTTQVAAPPSPSTPRDPYAPFAVTERVSPPLIVVKPDPPTPTKARAEVHREAEDLFRKAIKEALYCSRLAIAELTMLTEEPAGAIAATAYTRCARIWHLVAEADSLRAVNADKPDTLDSFKDAWRSAGVARLTQDAIEFRASRNAGRLAPPQADPVPARRPKDLAV